MGGFGSVFLFYIIISNMKLLSELAPYLDCRHRYRQQAQAVGTEAVAAVVVSAGAHRAQGIHIDFWGEFLSKKYFTLLGSEPE